MTSIEDLSKRVEALELEVKELKEDPEIWRRIKGNWGYMVSNRGRVKRYDGFVPDIRLNPSLNYYFVTLAGESYYLHRLLAEAFIPNPDGKPRVDHKDGNKQNNDLSNLRWCTVAENAYNSKTRSTNTSGYRGVSFIKEKGKYRARIRVKGRETHLGYFHTPEEASAVYEAAAKELHGEFYRAPE